MLKDKQKPTSKFSHAFYDDCTDIVFMYFAMDQPVNIQFLGQLPKNLLGKRVPDKCRELTVEEFCLHLDRETYAQMRKYLIEHPEPSLL